MLSELQSLEALLEAEAALLRRGEIDGLAPLLAQKEAAWTRAQNAMGPSQRMEDLSRIQEVARRNAHLLAAARAGLDAAKTKVEKAKMPRRELSTYNAQGQKAALGARKKTEIKID